MNEFIAIDNILEVLQQQRTLPAIVMWNRTEGRPRTDNFERALKAEVRDALFLLTKQWQMGEFRGDDAGSPIFAKVHCETTRLDKYRAGDNPVQPFEEDIPLEAKVEQKRLPLGDDHYRGALDIALLMGRHWLKLLATPDLIGLRPAFLAAYGFTAPDPAARADAVIAAHRRCRQAYAAVAGRTLDGSALYRYLTEAAGNHSWDRLAPAPAAPQQAALELLEHKFIAWFERLFSQPRQAGNDAWQPSRLEYRFACSTPQNGGEKVLRAEAYHHGHLDWYNFDIDPGSSGLGRLEPAPPVPSEPLEQSHTTSFFPVPIRFDGMPHTRWWTFEDGHTNFGDIRPDTTDLGKLLLIEFGLIFANDWFLVPFTLPTGTIAAISGLAVTNVFGERTWLQPAGRGSDADWQRWNMFTLSLAGEDDRAADRSLVLTPTNAKIQEGAAIEEVNLIRDEVANMVWGVETKVPLPDGTSVAGREAALEMANHFRQIVAREGGGAPSPLDAGTVAGIRYQLVTGVPEHWIPFIPVHVPGDRREIQLQRAAMPRIIEGDTQPAQKVRPRTRLLRPGLDQAIPDPYFVFEEEVPRSGIRVSQSYRRTRWYNGRVFNWLGAGKQTARGERSSNLAFDQIIPTEKKKDEP